MPDAAQAIDFDAALTYTSLVFDTGDWIEFRALPDERANGSRCIYRQAGSDLEHDDSLEAWLTAHNVPGWALYVGPNPRQSGRGSGVRGMGTDADVAHARCLFADFDNAAMDEAIDRIESNGMPSPTLVVSSGRATGTHVYWMFKETILDLTLWTRLQSTVNRVLGADSTIKNPSRIMRLPGSVNHRWGAPCYIRGMVTDRYTSWQVMNIEPASERAQEWADLPAGNVVPRQANLNTTTLLFLQNPTPEGQRNVTLFAAAMDYNGNGFPIEQAMEDLAHERAVARDGLDSEEAEAAVRSAYSRRATPTHRTVIDPQMSMEMFAADLNADTGSISTDGADIDPADDVDWLSNADPSDRAPVESAPRVDRRPRSFADRPAVGNVAVRAIINSRNQRQMQNVVVPIDQIAATMSEALDGWPRRAASCGLFATKETKDGDVKLWNLQSPSQLFAFMQDRARIHWHSGNGEMADGTVVTTPTKSEFFDWVQENIEPSYHDVAELPHVPPKSETYYLPCKLPDPTGDALSQLLARLNPATEVDRSLMLAAMMTPGWGGPAGARPLFVFTSDYGQGSGKTETAKAICNIWGGAVTLDYEDSWANVSKRIMSSQDWLSRTFLFDNVKGRFGGSAIEAAVTQRKLSGHRMFTGTVSRDNDATFFVTFNMPEMTRDLAQRSIIIKIGRPRTDDFIGWAEEFITEHRMQIISDLLSLLRRQPRGEVSPANRDRWQVWQKGVLSRVPDGDVNEMANEIIGRRPGADAEADEASDIVAAIGGYLKQEQRPGGDEVEVTAAEMVRVLRATGNWRDSDSQSSSANSRKCLLFLKRRLTGRGVLHPLTEPGPDGRPRERKVRVDEDGRPAGGRSDHRSAVYRWVWEAAEEIVGSAEWPPPDMLHRTVPPI